jgi:hypothetical protein
MALFSECSLECASKLLDTADIVREAIFHQLMPASYLTFVAESAEGQMSLKAQKDRNRRF